MKILVIHQHYCPENGIGNNRTGEIFEHFHELFGHEIEIITSRSAFPQNHPAKIAKNIYTFVEKGLKIHVLPVNYSHFDSFYSRIQSFIRFFYQAYQLAKTLDKPDIVYGISTPPSVAELAYRLAKKWKIPWFFETVDVWPDVPIGMKILSNNFITRLISQRVNFLYTKARGIIALSPGMKQQIESHGIKSDKIWVSYNGSNSDKFPFHRRHIVGKIRFLYAGTIGEANDIDFLLQAIHKCKDLPAEFVIIGDGNESWKISQFIQEKKPENLIYHASIAKNEINTIFALADVGVVTFANFPVLEANSANKFYDYLMSGLPVLTNYEGWQKEILEINGCGKSSKQGDLQAFCENIKWFCTHSQELANMGKNGYEFAKTHYNRQTIAVKLENWIQKQMTINT